ncbi:PREDICTED: mitochondrial inner membrane protein COX18 [Dufourea novaeangliae]|uniref:Mitochondrial inner membrane protein COX18 n=1 Tax=Dufourea novaeangliae TaxID=178035 RepID=A0A154NWD0_DUFNO|nr:PREDICTED: mitochondrial inner membrane protein COX18 [Dufourea novaeangliae]KZC03957.1 Mitochondrial inner membrane protein COX18 [Dufourea novaeangliae]
MITQVLRKVVLDFKHNGSIFVKYYHCIDVHLNNALYPNMSTNVIAKNKVLVGYFLTKQYASKKCEIPVYQKMHTSLFNAPLYHENYILLPNINSINYYPTQVNSIRWYSNATPVVLNGANQYYGNGILKSISESLPVECTMDAFKMLHSSTQLPWWATIILATIISRTLVSLPLTIFHSQIKAKIENLQPEIVKIMKKLNMETRMACERFGWSGSYAAKSYKISLKREMSDLFNRKNCHPGKIYVSTILQIPLWVSFSVALRNFCNMLPNRDAVAFQDYLEFANGGFGWIKNLTDVDHLFILPIFFGLSGLATLEIQTMLSYKKEAKYHRYLLAFYRAVTICLVPIIAYVPSGLGLFWTVSNFYTIFQIMLVQSPKFRRLVRIPKTESELQHPYTELYKKVKHKLHLQ